MNNSIELARFHISLFEIQEAIAAANVRANQLQCPVDELLQTLDLAAQSIEAYLNAYRLEAVPVGKESK